MTADIGRKCSYLGEPYINNCGYDTPASLFVSLLGKMVPSVSPLDSNVCVGRERGRGRGKGERGGRREEEEREEVECVYDITGFICFGEGSRGRVEWREGLGEVWGGERGTGRRV